MRQHRKGTRLLHSKAGGEENFSRTESLRYKLIMLRQLIRESEMHTEALRLRAEEIKAEREELLKE